MNLFHSNAASAYVSPTLSAIAFGRNSGQRHGNGWPQAVQSCAEILAQASDPPRASGPPHALTVYVGAAALRATLLDAECGARNQAEYQALAQQQLMRHEGAPEDWTVQCALIAPRVGALAVALPRALLEALQQWAARARIKQLSVQPAFLAPLRASASTWGKGSNRPWAIVLAEPGALVTVQTLNTNHVPATHPALTLGIQTCADVATALPREQARARFTAGSACTLHTWQLQTTATPASRQASAIATAIPIAGLQFVPHGNSDASENTL